jgi:hypothetical protein
MKTTLEIPDAIFRRAKAAAERGIALRQFVTEAVKDKLAVNAKLAEKPWVSISTQTRPHDVTHPGYQ